MSRFNLEESLTASMPFRVLLFDDEMDSAQQKKEELEQLGGSSLVVDLAGTANEATELVQRELYDAVLADVYIKSPVNRPGSVEQGDEWLLANSDRMQNARCYAVTAFPKRIRDRKALGRKGIVVIEKADPEEHGLYTSLAKLAKRKREVLAKRMRPLISQEVGFAASGRPHIDPEIRRAVIDYFKTRTGADVSSVAFGSRRYSLEDLAVEVEQGSAVGLRVVRMFVAEFRRVVGLDSLSREGQDESK